MADSNADDLGFVTTAGKRYLAQMAASDAAAPERELLQALGAPEVGSIGHRRAFGLGLAVARRPLARWGLPKIGPAADVARSLRVAQACVLGSPGLSALELDRACHLDQGCIDSPPGSEEEFYARAIYGAVAALSRFSLYAGLPDGVDVLKWARLADGEEYERLPGEMHYDKWLTEIALPAAYRERPVSEEELNPGWIGRRKREQ
jgi:hypothetical protein